jgi:hypothetical protein
VCVQCPSQAVPPHASPLHRILPNARHVSQLHSVRAHPNRRKSCWPSIQKLQLSGWIPFHTTQSIGMWETYPLSTSEGLLAIDVLSEENPSTETSNLRDDRRSASQAADHPKCQSASNMAKRATNVAALYGPQHSTLSLLLCCPTASHPKSWGCDIRTSSAETDAPPWCCSERRSEDCFHSSVGSEGATWRRHSGQTSTAGDEECKTL